MEENERLRLNTEWATTNALREIINIARRGDIQATYRHAIALGEDLLPELFDPHKRILEPAAESDNARYYRQKAAAETTRTGRHTTPLELIDEDIRELKAQVDVEPDADLLKSKLETLEKVRSEIKPKKYTENQLIFGDAFHSGFNLPMTGDGKGYREYRIDKARALRIRILHPDPPEHKIGADLIYENHDRKKKSMRVALLQYKTWDGQIFHYDPRLEGQMKRMRGFACQGRLCDPDTDRRRSYRLPNCAAFLRPTDSLHDPKARKISSGLHIPICVVDDNWEANQNKGRSLRRSSLEDRSLSHRLFQELFNNRMAGSKEIPASRLEELYKAFKVLESDESVLVHAQEFMLGA